MHILRILDLTIFLYKGIYKSILILKSFSFFISLLVPSEKINEHSCNFEDPKLCNWTRGKYAEESWHWGVMPIGNVIGVIGIQTDHTLKTMDGKTFQEFFFIY